MRIIFKILAAPFVLVLTLLVAVLSFLLSLSAGLLSILASVGQAAHPRRARFVPAYPACVPPFLASVPALSRLVSGQK